MSYTREKREPEYPAELESQLLLRMPEEPAKALRELLRSGDTLKNRLSVQVDNDMRHGEIRFDNWVMHCKIVDLPTIIESLKTIDNKSFYKTADLCQMMICKEGPEQTPVEEETPKNKKRDPFKVDKKFLWPHGVTPPTKNVRKRRFRKTLRKKCVEAPEIEKEVKRLLRADNEAVSVTWQIIKEEEEEEEYPSPEHGMPVNVKQDKKQKSDRRAKRESVSVPKKSETSDVVDIFGGALSDSDLEEDNLNVELEDSHLSAYDSRPSDTNSMHGLGDISSKNAFPVEFDGRMFHSRKASATHTITSATSGKGGNISSEEDLDYQPQGMSKHNMTLKIDQLKAEVEELKQRRQRTQHEISGLENMALRQRFQDILHTLNQDIMFKEMEYQGMLTMQNSEDI